MHKALAPLYLFPAKNQHGCCKLAKKNDKPLAAGCLLKCFMVILALFDDDEKEGEDSCLP